MAFRLKRRKHLNRQVARVVARELESAVATIKAAPLRSARSVHTVRKHLKKARAIVRMLEEEFGKDFKPLIGRLRGAARRLSAFRDADVCLETLDALRGRYPRVLTPAVTGSVQRALEAHRRRARSRLEHALPVVLSMLRASAAPISRGVRHAADPEAVREGMARGYRRARKALETTTLAGERGGDAALHRWRRRVKDHWYQMRLLEGLDAHAGPRVRALKRLETWLGDHHNLVVLDDLVQRSPSRFGSGSSVAAVLGCIDRRKAALERRFRDRGTKLFEYRPARFRKLIDRWWNTSHHG